MVEICGNTKEAADMSTIPFCTTAPVKKRPGQDQLRAGVGLALLSLTLGTQLIWSFIIR